MTASDGSPTAARSALYDIDVGHELTWGAGLELDVLPEEVALLLEAWGKVSLDPDIRSASEEHPAEALAAVRYWPHPEHAVTLGAGRGLSAGYGSPTFRAMLGYTFTWQAPKDRDGDGIVDPDDACPDEPEDRDGFEDTDGCPEPDNDGDGILDVDDDCPFDSEDRCKVRKTECSIIITEAIHFESAKDVIQPVSFPVLDSVRDALRSNPGIALLEVQGHTDSKGGDAYNQDLSQRRAASVVRYLTENHIEAARLSPIGHGEARPIASNRSSRGRAHNRRVEFIILDPKPTEECLQQQSVPVADR